MNLTFVCLNADGDTLCSKCHKTIGNQAHHKGVWFPERPFEPNGAGRGYVYALCISCYSEIIDKKTNMPSNTWLLILEDEIQELITSKRINRIKLDTSKMSGEKVFEEQMFFLTGRRGIK
ncbi:MAG: hypothetical protein Q8O41_09425 [Candidatus Methanoperedens sp.]|nr:hypothetical protein [Candidatus Methanoperedens sp.]